MSREDVSDTKYCKIKESTDVSDMGTVVYSSL